MIKLPQACSKQPPQVVPSHMIRSSRQAAFKWAPWHPRWTPETVAAPQTTALQTTSFVAAVAFTPEITFHDGPLDEAIKDTNAP